ncbi:TIM barrel protein [Chloroflexi bacterium TSY]|nr:TIM barrel protein [Chloroflexi bacterium TSY]
MLALSCENACWSCRRYEQHLLRRQADGVEIIQRAGEPPGVALISDFFHMHIEETSTPDTLREVGKYVAHVHMADNTPSARHG